MPRKKAVEASPFENPYVDNSVAIKRLTKDLTEAGRTMTADEARFLVDQFYISQANRIRYDAQVRAMSETQEPTMLLDWLGDQSSIFEKQIERALTKYTDDHPIGKWIKLQHGFGGILAAGLLAHLDIEKAPTAGHFWAYAGLNPNVSWEKGEKRPWNAELKKLIFKAGEVQIKMAGSDNNYYGKLINERKAYEWERNFTAGEKAEQDAIRDRDNKLYASTTEAWAWVNGCYRREDVKKRVMAGMSLAAVEIKDIKRKPGEGDPMLPPSQLHGRARRHGMKIFLSHLHEVWYEHHYKERVPKPFVIEHMGHVHRIEVPHYNSPYAQDVPRTPFKVLKHTGDTADAFFEDLQDVEVGQRLALNFYSTEIQEYFANGQVEGFELKVEGKKKYAIRISGVKPSLKT